LSYVRIIKRGGLILARGYKNILGVPSERETLGRRGGKTNVTPSGARSQFTRQCCRRKLGDIEQTGIAGQGREFIQKEKDRRR